jgi:hypothetical protein
LSVTSSPPGANVEINGVLVETTAFHAEYPGGYFHKTHVVFTTRLDHSMILRVSKDGYSPQQIALADGPFERVALKGEHYGNYFLLKSDHFELKLEPAGLTSNETWPEDDRVGPIHPRNVAASLGGDLDKSELKASGKQNWERELEVTKDSELTLHPGPASR